MARRISRFLLGNHHNNNNSHNLANATPNEDTSLVAVGGALGGTATVASLMASDNNGTGAAIDRATAISMPAGASAPTSSSDSAEHNKENDRKQFYAAATATALYAIINSQMLLVNKICMHHIRSANFAMTCQLAFTAAFVHVAGRQLKVVECDQLEWAKVKRFLPATWCFVGLLYSSMLAIKRVPVDTFVCTRNSVPLVIALAEWMFLGRSFPSPRSIGALLLVLGGVVLYVQLDVHFDSEGYAMLLLWYCFCLCESLYTKHIVDSMEMSTWSRSYYFNLLAIPACLVLYVAGGDHEHVMNQQWTFWAVFWLLLSCVFGVGMSYSSFRLRRMISATSFSLVGNVCKVLTIVVNFIIWDQHATNFGFMALSVSLFGAMMYRQAPMRSELAAGGSGK